MKKFIKWLGGVAIDILVSQMTKDFLKKKWDENDDFEKFWKLFVDWVKQI